MIRLLTGASALALILALLAGTALAQETWQSSALSDETGQPQASLSFGIPDSDAMLLAATCRPDQPGQIEMMLNLPLPAEAVEGPSTVTFGIGSRVEQRPGEVQRIGSEGKEGPVLRLLIDRNDTLWDMLMAGSSSRLSAEGGNAVPMHLSGSRAAISSFLRGCDTLAAGGPVQAADWEAPTIGELGALAGPLFVVGDAPAEATSSFSGAELPAFAPGTELMATGSRNSQDGEDWIEVQPGRGSGPAAWVRRSDLVPVSGGASEYQNLNQAANLLLREAPDENAATVGTVPPRAAGLFDQGQREGGWVLVRYGEITGWAAHDYLLPMVPMPDGQVPEDAEMPLDGQAPAEDPVAEPEPYQARYEGWQVSCDPCVSFEDVVCSLSAGEAPHTLTVVADDAGTDSVGDMRIGMDLPPDPQGTLAITVDGEQAAAIQPAEIVYMAMTNEFLIEQPRLDTVLTAMGQGERIAFAFIDSAGQVESFSLPLAGFSGAVTDLLATSPDYPRDAACRME